ncbi:Hsp70 family protein [Dactylosporangium sp. CA-139066]|uniref:Hsp70 family protein n=1 Tax=Dactylosporangium sp. CA-139066 TaxID=3239930 RepID=UPI003D91D232
MSPAFGLGIDFGTSNTVALMRWPDGRVRPLLFDANPLLPSAVFAPSKPGPGSAAPESPGELVVGGDALHHARFDPAGLEPNPKQHIDEQAILLGAREVAVTELVAAVLRFVYAEARRVAGSDDFAVALAHPAGWGTSRRAVLAEAARRAGLGSARLVPEPVAAAHAFTAVLGQQVPTGKALVVYDLGAGTFDASVVVRRPAGFEAVAVDGLTDVGGLDIDATIVRWLGERYSPNDPELWNRLADAQDAESLRHRRMLWHDARVAKEMLSRAPAVVLQMPPPLNVDAQLTRDEFEAAAKPLLERTVFTTAALIRQAGVAPDDVAGVLLVGGGSRIPLVATMLHRSLGIAPTITEQPEIVVAEGCLLSLSAAPGDGAGAPGEGPLWPAAAAAAAPYASMAAAQSPPAPISPNAPVPPPSPIAPNPVAANPVDSNPVAASMAAPPVDGGGPAWPAWPEGGQPVPGTSGMPAEPVSGMPGAPVSSVPTSGAPAREVGSAPVSGVPAAPVSGVPVSGAPGARGTLYQTGQFPTVTPQAPPPVNRYVPPPMAVPYAAAVPVSPGPQSRVIPVYDDGRSGAPVRPASPAGPPLTDGRGPRRERGNLLNAILVVVALIALAGAGTTIYLVQLDKKPAATSETPTPDTTTGDAPSQDGGGAVGGDDTATATSTTTRAQATTQRAETITMPDLSGLYIDYAKEQLRDAGFDGTIRTQQRTTSDADQVGHVLAQDPKANKQVAKNGTVTLWVGALEASPKTSAPPKCTPGPGCPTASSGNGG